MQIKGKRRIGQVRRFLISNMWKLARIYGFFEEKSGLK